MTEIKFKKISVLGEIKQDPIHCMLQTLGRSYTGSPTPPLPGYEDQRTVAQAKWTAGTITMLRYGTSTRWMDYRQTRTWSPSSRFLYHCLYLHTAQYGHRSINPWMADLRTATASSRWHHLDLNVSTLEWLVSKLLPLIPHSTIWASKNELLNVRSQYHYSVDIQFLH